LDSIAIPLATVAGTAVMVSTVADLSPVVTWALAIIAGGGTAATIKTASGATRLTSSVSTAGLGNPLVTTIETGSSIVMTLMSLFLPFVGFVLAIVVLIVFYILYKKFKTTS